MKGKIAIVIGAGQFITGGALSVDGDALVKIG
jgi:hypothetical protein